jgi:hypothetical protein
MIEKLKHGLTEVLLRLARPKIERWFDTRVLYVSKKQREELAKRFGVAPELVDAVYQMVRTRALDELNRVWSEKR